MTTSADLLHAIAQDLTALADPDLILTGLVRRVRATLRCDLAYVSLNDPDTRDTRIRFSDGIRTAEYASISMPIGTGVLGMAAAGVTTESPDYLPDLAKLHIAAVDVAVNLEGVRAILGTPLRAGGEILGALTVANRTPGGFTPDQRAQLEEAALIGSTAAEIHLLRHALDHRQREFDRETSRLRQRAASTSGQLHLFRELATALASGDGSQQLLDIAARAVRGTVRLSDPNSAPASGSTIVRLEGGGALEIAGADPVAASALATTVGLFVSIALLYENAIEDARHFREAELVERLVDPPVDGAGPPPRTGLPGGGPYDVIVADVDDPLSLRAALSSVRRLLGPLAISASRRHSIVVIGRRDTAVHPSVIEALSPFRFSAGAATAAGDPRLPAAYSEAALLARASRQLGRLDRIATWADLGVVSFAIGGGPTDAAFFVNAQLAPVASDSERDAALRETALRYLDARGSVSTVATQLGLHENTVRQRLNRLDQLLPGWRQGPDSLDIHVALRARLLMEDHAR